MGTCSFITGYRFDDGTKVHEEDARRTSILLMLNTEMVGRGRRGGVTAGKVHIRNLKVLILTSRINEPTTSENSRGSSWEGATLLRKEAFWPDRKFVNYVPCEGKDSVH